MDSRLDEPFVLLIIKNTIYITISHTYRHKVWDPDSIVFWNLSSHIRYSVVVTLASFKSVNHRCPQRIHTNTHQIYDHPLNVPPCIKQLHTFKTNTITHTKQQISPEEKYPIQRRTAMSYPTQCRMGNPTPQQLCETVTPHLSMPNISHSSQWQKKSMSVVDVDLIANHAPAESKTPLPMHLLSTVKRNSTL